MKIEKTNPAKNNYFINILPGHCCEIAEVLYLVIINDKSEKELVDLATGRLFKPCAFSLGVHTPVKLVETNLTYKTIN